jgi:hypothetical protein
MAVADVTQTTAASQPLLLAHSGVNYWWGSGADGNYCSTPNAAANQITGDIEIYSNVNNEYGISSPVFNVTCGIQKGITPNQKSWGLVWQYNVGSANYQLRYVSSNNGTTYLVDNTSSNFIPTSLNFYVKVTHQVDNGSSQNIVKFYYSNDNINFILISTSTNSGAHLRFNSSSLCTVGGGDNSFVNPLRGKIYRATISNSIGGAPVVDFNPATYNASTSQTAWTSATGEVWTINTGTAATGYKGVLVDRTICMGDGIDDRMESGTLTSKVNFSEFIACNPFQIAAATQIIKDGLNGSTHVFYKQTGAGLYIYNSGTGAGSLQYNGESSNLLQIFNSNYNTTSSSTILNNGTPQSGALGNDASLKFSLFAATNSTNFANTIINSIIQLNTIASSPQQTSTYNVVKTMNSL